MHAQGSFYSSMWGGERSTYGHQHDVFSCQMPSCLPKEPAMQHYNVTLARPEIYFMCLA